MKILVVGCGSIGERHLSNLLSLGHHDVAVCDANETRLKDIQTRYTIPAYLHLTEALETNPNLSLICTPNHLHLPIAMQVAKTGSHLFIEKPLASRLDGIAELVELVEQQQLVCMVGCNMRFHAAIARMHELISNSAIGRILSIRAHYGHYLPNWRPNQDYRSAYSSQAAQGGGIILDAIHEIDYARWFGGEVFELFCYAQKISDLEIEVEDTADILIQFVNGGQAAIHIDYLDQVKRRSCEIVGTKGTLVWRSVRKQPEEAILEYHQNNQEQWIEYFEVDPNEAYLAELQHLLTCVSAGAKPLLDIRDAWTDLVIALAAHESARQRQPITIEPVWNKDEA